MTRSELIVRLTARFEGKYSDNEVRDLLTELFDQIGDLIIAGRRVELRGFGALSLRRLGSKKGRNPKTSERIDLEERNAIYFRAAKQMRENVQDVMPEKE